MEAYCINLERSPERRLQAQALFEREGLDVRFFRATDWNFQVSKWGLLVLFLFLVRNIIIHEVFR